MAANGKSGWLQRRVEGAIERGLNRAYASVRVDPDRYLYHLRGAHSLPVTSFRGMFTLDPMLLDAIADQTIRASMKMAATEGAGLGLFGFITVLPDLSILSVITLRMIQKLSLIYGFEFNSDEEMAELWVAAASAAGVDLGRELLEKEVVNRFVPRVIERIAVRASAEVVEKWSARLIPVASSVLGGGLNYYFVRAWGERARRHFRQKHDARRQQLLLPAAELRHGSKQAELSN